MYPSLLPEVAADRNAERRHEVAALRRARAAARASKKSRRGGAGHRSAPAPAGPAAISVG